MRSPTILHEHKRIKRCKSVSYSFFQRQHKIIQKALLSASATIDPKHCKNTAFSTFAHKNLFTRLLAQKLNNAISTASRASTVASHKDTTKNPFRRLLSCSQKHPTGHPFSSLSPAQPGPFRTPKSGRIAPLCRPSSPSPSAGFCNIHTTSHNDSLHLHINGTLHVKTRSPTKVLVEVDFSFERVLTHIARMPKDPKDNTSRVLYSRIVWLLAGPIITS